MESDQVTGLVALTQLGVAMSQRNVEADAAVLICVVHRFTDGRVGWSVAMCLPGCSDDIQSSVIDPAEDEETLSIWRDDFHGVSKAHRSLMECVLADWSSYQHVLD